MCLSRSSASVPIAKKLGTTRSKHCTNFAIDKDTSKALIRSAVISDFEVRNSAMRHDGCGLRKFYLRSILFAPRGDLWPSATRAATRGGECRQMTICGRTHPKKQYFTGRWMSDPQVRGSISAKRDGLPASRHAEAMRKPGSVSTCWAQAGRLSESRRSRSRSMNSISIAASVGTAAQNRMLADGAYGGIILPRLEMVDAACMISTAP